MTATPAISLTPPGPGVWQLDISHFGRPLTRFLQATLPADFAAGQERWMPRYGIPMKTIQARSVDGFVYIQPEPLGGPAGAAPPPAWIFWLLSRVVPVFRRCRAAGIMVHPLVQK